MEELSLDVGQEEPLPEPPTFQFFQDGSQKRHPRLVHNGRYVHTLINADKELTNITLRFASNLSNCGLLMPYADTDLYQRAY